MERPEGSLEALHPLGCPAAQQRLEIGKDPPRSVDFPRPSRLLKVGNNHVEVEI